MDPRIEQLQEFITAQKPEKADAIVWLQGNGYDRGIKALDLYDQMFAPWIVITGNNIRVVEDDRVHVLDMVAWLTARDVPHNAIVVDDQSSNTRDQAVHVIDIMIARGWQRMLLVGSIHHQLRAFLTFLFRSQEVGWNGRIINQPFFLDWDARPSGRRKTAGEAFQDELIKLETYRGNVATVEEGLKYLATL